MGLNLPAVDTAEMFQQKQTSMPQDSHQINWQRQSVLLFLRTDEPNINHIPLP